MDKKMNKLANLIEELKVEDKEEEKFECCIESLTHGRIKNCVTEVRKAVRSFKSLDALIAHMKTQHKVNLVREVKQ